MECMEIGLMSELAPAIRIENAILLTRGQKALLDPDLADLYGVDTKVLVQSGQAKCRTFSGRLYLSARSGGNYAFEVPDWNLKGR
jgi:hypothetical protein